MVVVRQAWSWSIKIDHKISTFYPCIDELIETTKDFSHENEKPIRPLRPWPNDRHYWSIISVALQAIFGRSATSQTLLGRQNLICNI